MKSLNRVERDNLKKTIPSFSVGDTVRVSVKVVEGNKVRNQIFQGTVIGRRGGGVRETFIVRKISGSIAVERIFPLHSPSIEAIELVRKGRVRRAQLTYMKERRGKAARIETLRTSGEKVADGTAAAAKAAAKGSAVPPSLDTVPAEVEEDVEGKAEALAGEAEK